jgi:hypothetical protein
MFLHVKDVSYMGGYELILAFNNGKTVHVDLENELTGTIFEPLRDPSFFQQVSVNPETETIEWPNGADFAPEFLYEIGQLVETAVSPD